MEFRTFGVKVELEMIAVEQLTYAEANLFRRHRNGLQPTSNFQVAALLLTAALSSLLSEAVASPTKRKAQMVIFVATSASGLIIYYYPLLENA